MILDYDTGFFQPALEAMQLEDTWFQQDGATAHTAMITMNCLRQIFPGRLISLRGDVNWPARSPDLAPCDFFLWGYRPNTLEDLINNIHPYRVEFVNIFSHVNCEYFFAREN